MIQGLRQHLDFIGIGLLSGVVVWLVLAVPEWASPVRIALTFLWLLCAPGYTLTAALFPKADDVDGAERLVLSLGLSVVVVPLLGLALHYTPWGIHLLPMTLGLSSFTVMVLVFALYRRWRLEPNERFYPPANGATFWTMMSMFLLVGSVFAAVVTAAQALRPPERATEFYLLGPEGRLDGYPTTLAPGETFVLTFRISNHEGRREVFYIHIPFDSERALIEVPEMEDGESWEAEVELKAPEGAGRTQLDFELYRTRDAEPYRSLHLFITLTATGQQLAQKLITPRAEEDVRPWP